jgi:predicted DNA-binding transcriptional regulator AlpA
MNETPMLFPITPFKFWKQIRMIIEQVIAEKLIKQNHSLNHSLLPVKALFKALEVCKIFEVPKPTIYQWLKQKKLKSFKVKSRRYFLSTEIESVISAKPESETNKK